jgi:hypothetical protein
VGALGLVQIYLILYLLADLEIDEVCVIYRRTIK